MQYLRVLVEHLADAVAAVLAHHRVVVLFRVLLDNVADIAQGGAGLDELQGLVQALLGDLDQALGVGCHIAHLHHDAGVAVVFILDHGDIDIDDIAVLQFLGVRGNAVAHHIVDRGADRAREAVVVQRGGNGLLCLGNVVVTDAVQFPGGDPDLTWGSIISRTSAASRPATRILSISAAVLIEAVIYNLLINIIKISYPGVVPRRGGTFYPIRRANE